MNRFAVTDLPLAGLKLVERHPLGDSRGFLARLFCADDLAKAGWTLPIAQINHTCTTNRGAVRGMHLQRPPHSEMKLVSCVQGEVWDVAVDVRAGSKTFLTWHAEYLSAENGHAMLIPEGFAHGFQATTDNAQLLYCHSAVYNADAEMALNARDPFLKIDWPLEIGEMSDRDRNHPMLTPQFAGISL